MAFFKFTGAARTPYSALNLTAFPGNVYDFGVNTPPADGLWTSDPGPANATDNRGGPVGPSTVSAQHGAGVYDAVVSVWQPNTQYAAGQPVINPSGELVRSLVPHTSGTTHNPANWSTPPSGTYSSLAAEAQLPQLRLFNVTLDGNSNESAGSFRWSDGEVGVYALLATDSATLEPSSWSVTKTSLSKTFTQPVMTFDVNSNVITRPAIVVT